MSCFKISESQGMWRVKYPNLKLLILHQKKKFQNSKLLWPMTHHFSPVLMTKSKLFSGKSHSQFWEMAVHFSRIRMVEVVSQFLITTVSESTPKLWRLFAKTIMGSDLNVMKILELVFPNVALQTRDYNTKLTNFKANYIKLLTPTTTLQTNSKAQKCKMLKHKTYNIEGPLDLHPIRVP